MMASLENGNFSGEEEHLDCTDSPVIRQNNGKQAIKYVPYRSSSYCTYFEVKGVLAASNLK